MDGWMNGWMDGYMEREKNVTDQGIGAITVAKHHSLLVLLIDIILGSHLPRLLCPHTKVIEFHASSGHWLSPPTP